jgi:hypothetical protein
MTRTERNKVWDNLFDEGLEDEKEKGEKNSRKILKNEQQ